MRPAAFAVLLILSSVALPVTSASARVERFAIVIGNDAGAPDEPQLRYAETDALRVYEVLRELGGYEPAQMALLRGEDAATVRNTLIAFNDRIRQLSSRPDTDVVLFVYYSGHADAERLHLGASALGMTELAQLVRGSAAQFRLVVLDACQSGSLTRTKGAHVGPAFALPAEAGTGEGVAFLTASAAGEDAQESDALGGSFFTHAFVSGLLGAADHDRDGRVVLDEAYRYAYDATLRATSRTFAGTQHPSFRYDYRGRGDIVLTEPAAYSEQRATLRFPPNGEFLLLHQSDSGVVVADLGSHAGSRQLSVRPGRYFVRMRLPDVMYEGTLEVVAGSTQWVDTNRFTRTEYARLLRKGMARRSSVHGIEAGMAMRSALPNEGPSCVGWLAGYALDLADFGIGARLSGCSGAWAEGPLAANTSSYALTGRIYRAWDHSFLSLQLGVQLGGALFVQRFETTGVAPARTTFAPMIGPHVGLGIDLSRGWFGAFELASDTFLLRVQEPRREPSLRLQTALRSGLAFGKRL